MEMMHGMMERMEGMGTDDKGKQKMKEMRDQMEKMMKTHQEIKKRMGK